MEKNSGAFYGTIQLLGWGFREILVTVYGGSLMLAINHQVLWANNVINPVKNPDHIVDHYLFISFFFPRSNRRRCEFFIFQNLFVTVFAATA